MDAPMWLTEFVKAVKIALIEQHRMKRMGGTNEDPLVECPDGEYTCNIDGHDELIIVKDGKFDFRNINARKQSNA